MRNKIDLLVLMAAIITLTISCRKSESYSEYNKQLDNKYINQLIISGDNLWVISSDISSFVDIVAVIPPYQISLYDQVNGNFIINDTIPAIRSFALDNNLTPFITTFDNRVLKLKGDLSFVQLLTIPKQYYIQCMIFDSDNNLLLGTNSGGLYVYNKYDTLRFNTSNSILTSDFVVSLARDSRSDVWFVQGTDLFKVGESHAISKDQSTFPDHLGSAFDLSADKDNALWVSRWDGISFLIYRKSATGQWATIDPPPSSGSHVLRLLKADNKGTVWIVYSNYPKDILAYYNSGNWVEIQIPLSEITITDVETFGNEIIIGTSRGIYRMPMQ
jgi:ligand-binding sensor domain-containing protein